MLITNVTLPTAWFPHIGLKFYFDKVAFSIAGYDVYYYGLTMALACITALLMGIHNGKKVGIKSDVFYDFLPFAMIFGILGARTYYVLFNFDIYRDNLSSIFSLRQGGIAIYGALIGTTIYAYFYTKKRNINFLNFMDIAAVSIPIAQAIGRLGNFFNREAYGTYTDNIFAMRIMESDAHQVNQDILNHIVTFEGVNYVQVHPTFFYESIGTISIFIFTYFLFTRRKYYGQVFFTYLISYGVVRFFVEELRVDKLLIGHTNIAVSRVVSFVLVVSGIFLMYTFNKKYKNNPLPKISKNVENKDEKSNK